MLHTAFLVVGYVIAAIIFLPLMVLIALWDALRYAGEDVIEYLRGSWEMIQTIIHPEADE